MLVEMTNDGMNNWEWYDDSGLKWSTGLTGNISPLEAKSVNRIKELIKLKDAGFTAEEIIDLYKSEVV